MTRLFGTDGIRGVANEEPLTPDLAFRVGRQLEAGAQPLEDGGELGGGEQRGRTASEEDRRDPHARRPGEPAEEVELALERRQVGRDRAVLEGGGVEAAVAAALRAERDVDVEPQGLRRRRVVRQEGAGARYGM